MTTTTINCPLTGAAGATVERLAEPDECVLKTPAFDRPITFSGSCWSEIEAGSTLGSQVQKSAVQRYLFDQFRFGDPPKIDEYNIKTVAQYRKWSIEERARNFLQLMNETAGDDPAVGISLSDNHPERIFRAQIAAQATESEIPIFARLMKENGWVEFIHPGHLDRVVDNFDKVLRLTGKGWIEANEPPAGTEFDMAFVAMWFSDEVSAVREAILNGIANAGYKWSIVDQEHYTGGVVDKALAQIRRSRFVVADFTCGSVPPVGEDGTASHVVRGGVYYEAGFAQALGLPVISTVRQDVFRAKQGVHFDVRHYNHIVWDDPEQLTETLRNRIVGVVGWGPNPIPAPHE